MTDYGLDFIEFEIFKLESQANQLDFNAIQYSFFNQTIDSNVSVGSTYWYAVRSTHNTALASNISTSL